MNIDAKLVMLPLVLQRLGTQVDCSMMPGMYSTISSLGGISWNFSRVCLCGRTISLVWLTIFGCVSLPKYTNIGCRPSRSIAGVLNKPWYDVVYPQPSPKRHLVVLNLRNSNLFSSRLTSEPTFIMTRRTRKKYIPNKTQKHKYKHWGKMPSINKHENA